MVKKNKVLIIEDESAIANIMKDYLSVNHFDPHIVNTGHEAIQYMKETFRLWLTLATTCDKLAS